MKNSEEKYVIKNNSTGEFIAIDNNSGGYPYDTSLHQAKIWFSKEDAFRYKNMSCNEDWSLHTIKFSTEPCSWQDLK